ncbi:MAG: hypothetical protein AB1757_26205 [Acidobacteriota bacterium]
MFNQKPFSLRQWCLFCLALLALFTSVFAQKPQTESPASERRKLFPAPTVGLEVITSRQTEPVYKGIVGHFSIARDALAIVNTETAKDFSLVEVQAEMVTGVIRVRLSVIYNKLSEPQWWKNKKEKMVGEYSIAIGEFLRPAELLQFGIEPFEIKAISFNPVVLKRDEYPRIFNPSNAIEITEVEKSVAGYRFTIKNVSDKTITAVEMRSGSNGLGAGDIKPGETYEAINRFSSTNIEKYGLTIKMILYNDGTYEGDAKSASRYLARNEGYKIQAAKLLPIIEQALAVSDEELPDVFIKMEADLWQMQEAMDKPTAIEFLKTQYPAFDEPTISMLYEEFKSGFYNARNTLLMNMGPAKKDVEAQSQNYSKANQVTMFRGILTRLKETMMKTVSSNN